MLQPQIRFKILVAGHLDPLIAKSLSVDHDVTFIYDLHDDDLVPLLTEIQPEVLVVRTTLITEKELKASSALKLIVKSGTGVDTVQIDAAKSLGIRVCNCPGQNKDAVAELTLGLILSCDRRIPSNVIDSRNGKWNKTAYSEGKGLLGSTLGVLGFGAIGKAVAARAKAFKMNVVVYDAYPPSKELAEQLGVTVASSPLDIASVADFISIHVPALPSTAGMVNAEFLERVKPGTAIINCARSTIVDEDILPKYLDSKALIYATDAPVGEPKTGSSVFEDPLMHHPNVYITHHIGGSTVQALSAVAELGVEIVQRYSKGELIHCVNL
ncbi:hypothetical protein RCL1_002168 [Eukaryota sp. TZLM3-RCL]